MLLQRALEVLENAAQTDHWLVAFSGGADSVLLLDLALDTAQRSGRTRITVFYLHHYITPIETARREILDAMFKRAHELLPGRFRVELQQRNIAAIARRLRRSWEHTASLVRRRHLDRLAHQLGATSVFTGHQLSDYLETLQLRSERRIPADSWPALSAYDSVTGYIRPLYYLTRTQVRTIARERGLTWYEDPSNADMSVTRNRIRTVRDLSAPPAASVSYVRPDSATGVFRVSRREWRMPVPLWEKLSHAERARTIHLVFRRMAVIRKFTRNDYVRAQRLPFSLPPFFSHSEHHADGHFVIFRRGLGAARITRPPSAQSLRGDAVTRSLLLRMPYGRKSVVKIFSEKRLSPRERRLTWVQLNRSGSEAVQIFFPGGSRL